MDDEWEDDGWMKGWTMDGWKDRWILDVLIMMDGQMDGWMDG